MKTGDLRRLSNYMNEHYECNWRLVVSPGQDPIMIIFTDDFTPYNRFLATEMCRFLGINFGTRKKIYSYNMITGQTSTIPTGKSGKDLSSLINLAITAPWGN